MVIPSVRILWISDDKGYGLFSTEHIPKGTITYCQDPLDIVIRKDDVSRYPNALLNSIHKFAFEPPNGDLVLCWDEAKYINHCCSPNSLSTGYEFEIAVRDIQIGEELTTDYRLFSRNNHFACRCDNEQCPRPGMDGFDVPAIDRVIRSALASLTDVPQPLAFLIPPHQKAQLDRFLADPREYISIANELPIQR